MIKHIVMWKLVDSYEGMDRAKIAAEVQRRILAMQGTVPSLRHVECGIDFNRSERAWDVVLYSSFDDHAGLEAYQADPEHGKVKAFIGAVAAEMAVVDYEV